MKTWLTIAEAALLVGRHKSRVYQWIDNGLLPAHTASDGTLQVARIDVARVESITKRGRPRGAASPRKQKTDTPTIGESL